MLALEALDPNIKKYRTTQAAIQILAADGTPLANREVEVAQTRHKFWFGTAAFDLVALNSGTLQGADLERAEKRAALFTDLFNVATLPFYWGRFEPERGHPETESLMKAAQWCKDRGLPVKGHPLCWHTVTAPWLLPLGVDEIRQAQVDRVTREVGNFKGLIDTWDVVNEAVIMPVFDKYDNGITRLCQADSRLGLLKLMFETARAANPGACLLINDFDMSPAYDILIEGCLAAGLKFDAIGLQSHMHQGYWGVEKTLRILKQFERFNLPIHFTETTLVSGNLMPPEIVDLNDYQVSDWPSTPEGEERQRAETLLHYQTLLAHPLVQAITWWDMVDGGWLNAPAGLVRRDLTPKPAYQALFQLIKGDWWLPPTRLVTDAQGWVSLAGFLGEYELGVAGARQPFKLEAAGPASLTLRLP